MKSKKDTLWNKFLTTGNINDYINYKLYLRQKEVLENEANYQDGRNSIKDNWL